MPFMGRGGAIWAAVGASVVLIVLAVAAAEPSGTLQSETDPAEPVASPPSRSVSLAKVGGVFLAVPEREIDDPTLLPYPFMSPTPAPVVTDVDGTYMRTLTLADVGGARIGLPYRCLRCPPYRIDAGVSTLILHKGAYYLNHQLSTFRTLGSYVVEGDRITLFNDANCPQTPGVYRWKRGPHALTLRVVEDDCPFDGERADDLTLTSWTRVPACIRRIGGLWPGELAC